MEIFIAHIRNCLDAWGELLEVILNAPSLAGIVPGVVLLLIKSVQETGRSPGSHSLHTYFRKVFGGWLIVALELQLAADIVGAIVSPTTQQIVELGAIAVVRIFLNYFLNNESPVEIKTIGTRQSSGER